MSSIFQKHVGQYCVIRTYASGVHIATLDEISEGLSGFSATLSEGRRLHYWEGAFTLHQVADNGIDFKKSRLSDIKKGQYSISQIIEVLPISKGLVESFKKAKSHEF